MKYFYDKNIIINNNIIFLYERKKRAKRDSKTITYIFFLKKRHI